jgi:hypothetical protein
MKFKVYAKRHGRLVTLWDVRRTPTGLYFHGSRGPSYMSYHEDGAYWTRSGHTKMAKKRRTPLAELKGAYTLSTGTFAILAPMPTDPIADGVQLRNEDIVVEYPGIFRAEVILSDAVPTLEPIPSRANTQVFIIENIAPIVTFEFFENPTIELQIDRFPVPPVMALTFDANERI